MKRFVGAVVPVFLAAATAFAALGGGDVEFKVTGASNVFFTHDNHAGKQKIGCKECHYTIFTTRAGHKSMTMADMQKGGSCGACHNGVRAFGVAAPDSCPKCHR